MEEMVTKWPSFIPVQVWLLAKAPQTGRPAAIGNQTREKATNNQPSKIASNLIQAQHDRQSDRSIDKPPLEWVPTDSRIRPD
jgi:hypothetical protein